MNRPNIVRLVVFVSTVALSWATLTFGTTVNDPDLVPGAVAQRDYVAAEPGEVLDQAAYAAAQEAAAESVEPELMRSDEIESRIEADIIGVFESVAAGVVPAQRPEPLATISTAPATEVEEEPVPETTASTVPEGEETAPTQTTEPEPPPEPAVFTGLLFADADADGVFAAVEGVTVTDVGLGGIEMVARSEDDTEVVYELTAPDGTYRFEIPPGTWDIGPNFRDLENWQSLRLSTGSGVATVDCDEASECTVPAFGIAPLTRPVETQVDELDAEFSILDGETIQTLVAVANDDILRRTLGSQPQLPLILDEVQQELFEQFRARIEDSAELRQVQNDINQRPPRVTVDGFVNEEAERAAADLLINFIDINTVVDEEATAALRAEARETVGEAPYVTAFSPGQTIVEQGDRLDEFLISAINSVGAATDRTVRTSAVAAALGVLVAMLGYYLSRFRTHFWDSPRMVALLGLLIVVGAGAVRLTLEFEESASPYILPAVAMGYLAAVLFDNRMATLMALTMGVLAAIGTRDPGIITYGVLATLAPIGFVSRVSSRRAFRNSVAKSALVTGVIAAVSAWLFTVLPDATDQIEQIGLAVAWAVGASVVASLVALSIMPFFESLFDITTTLRLLELTDRNHEALQILQEKAFGTFNHSLMVGTLADAAARAINADNLLARAAAYYHDLGKTENPHYFIENQFGSINPHDELPPERSAQIIRDHVIDGMALAQKYKIPSEVSEGIVCHHGDAIMRFFYEKARQQYGDENVDVDDYRHAGHKPTSREMAIVMMADSVEGACRAVFGDEEPTPESIEKVVNRVVDEKVGDGQLGASDLTLGELTKVKSAFIDALVGHYHQRIPYPNFPGS